MAHNHKACIASALAEVERACTSRNLRLTDIRRQVLTIIWQGHKAVTAADVMRALGNDKPPITYRALEFLEENGFIHKVASLNAYVGCPHPEAPHASQFLICGGCRDVTEIHSHTLDAHVEAEAKQHNFHITRRHLEVMGLCAHCAKTH